MTQTFYVPGTEETDPKKIILSLQQIAAYLTKANFAFPATQNSSSDPNTLDDYEEGSWTPGLAFATPGDFAYTTSTAVGEYVKIGRLVIAHFSLVTSSFTHTTAAGNLQLTGLPFTVAAISGNAQRSAGCQWSGITKAGYTDLLLAAEGAGTFATVRASGSGVATANVTAADMPTGGSVVLRACIPYFV